MLLFPASAEPITRFRPADLIYPACSPPDQRVEQRFLRGFSERNRHGTDGMAETARTLGALLRHSTPGSFNEVLGEFKDSFKDPRFATQVLRELGAKCSGRDALQLSLELLRFMQVQLLQTNAFHYSAVIRAIPASVPEERVHRRSPSGWEVVIDLLADMDERRIPPDSVCWNSAITACGKGEHWEASLSFFERTAELGLASTVTMNAMMGAFSCAGEWARALDLFDAAARPDVITFSSAMAACEKGSSWRRSLDLLSSMHFAKLQPDNFSYSSVISACASAARWALACSVFEGMLSSSVCADLVSFCSLIKALDAGQQWQSALANLQHMRQKSMALSEVACNSAISACSSGSQWQQALSLISLMPSLGLAAEEVSYNTAISACVRASRWQTGLALFQELPASFIEPDLVSFNSALTACHASSKWQLSLTLLDVMTRKHLEPGEFCFTTTLSTAAEPGGWQLCLQVLDGLQARHVHVTAIMFGVLMSACEDDSAWEAALATLRHIESHHLIPDALHVGSAANAIRKGKDQGKDESKMKALQLISKMKAVWSHAWPGDLRPFQAVLEAWHLTHLTRTQRTKVKTHPPQGIVRIGEGVVACLKPAGVATEVFVENLRCETLPEERGPFSVVSRLDHPTSGILMLALGEAGSPQANWLQVQFASRLVDKKYICLCEGEPLGSVGSTGQVSVPLLADELQGRMVVGDAQPKAREALTKYTILARYRAPNTAHTDTRELTLLSVKPITGRMHQIRVHLAYLGRPLLGDLTYGAKASTLLTCERLFLHCRRVKLRDFTGQPFGAVAALPRELREVLDRLQPVETGKSWSRVDEGGGGRRFRLK